MAPEILLFKNIPAGGTSFSGTEKKNKKMAGISARHIQIILK
ncbi:MAG: hypothetical protein ACI8Q6_003894 [Granulosicoccus sp.]|jgi:hypothetical protein